MKIVLRKPSLPINKIKRPNKTNINLGFIKFLYDFEDFHKNYFPLRLIRLLLFIFVSSLITFLTYFLTSYIRADVLSIREIAEQVAFLNYAMWGAYLMFVAGLNLLIILFLKLVKISQDDRKFLLNQFTVAVGLYLFMRLVAMLIILLDEKLPFEINLQYSFLNFNLLTILFVAQIAVALMVYNYLILNLPSKLKNNKLILMLISLIYIASIWTLTAP